MKEFNQYIVDAFTKEVFSGNPAAVCLLDTWCPDATLSAIARENNLSETAFILSGPNGYEIRWFTPSTEVDLCGHATLASAFVILTYVEPALKQVEFHSKSGMLAVERQGDLFVLDFPSRVGTKVDCPDELCLGLGVRPQEVFLARDFLCVLDSEQAVRACTPKYELLQNLPSFGIIITAASKECDFVSRAFFPTDAILEDPVTGSTHCTLVPYWSKRLGKSKLYARQISARGGELYCQEHGARVLIGGNAVLFARGTIQIP